jgi:hypothetical protein
LKVIKHPIPQIGQEDPKVHGTASLASYANSILVSLITLNTIINTLAKIWQNIEQLACTLDPMKTSCPDPLCPEERREKLSKKEDFVSTEVYAKRDGERH